MLRAASSGDAGARSTFARKPGGVLERAETGRGDFRALLYGVVRNVARRYEERTAKSIQRAPGESVHLDDLPHQADALSRLFDRAWAQSLLREAVEHHQAASENSDPEANRRFRILRMRHDDGLPVRKIAAARQGDRARAAPRRTRGRRTATTTHRRSATTTWAFAPPRGHEARTRGIEPARAARSAR